MKSQNQDVLNIISSPDRERETVKISTEDIDRETKLVDLNIKKESLESDRQDRKERKNYADKVYRLIFGFLVIVLLIVIASGIKWLCFNLSDNVLITLLTTTSANVIGIFMIVMRYLFKQKNTSN
jgi:hypothetical protein